MGEKVRRLAQLGERRGGRFHRVDLGHRLVAFQGIPSPLVRRAARETKIRSEPKEAGVGAETLATPNAQVHNRPRKDSSTFTRGL